MNGKDSLQTHGPGEPDWDALIERYWPLVLSVCRRQLADPYEAEDAAQETFIKYLRHHRHVQSDPAGWLTATARTTSIDRIRKSIRERARWQRLGENQDTQHRERSAMTEHAARDRLPDGLLALDPAAAELLADRFFQKQPLRVLAVRYGVSVATMSRRVAQAVEQLAIVLEDMGVLGAADLPLPAYLANLRDSGQNAWPTDYYRDPGLCHSTHLPRQNTFGFPGWDRPMRVGVRLSYYQHAYTNTNGFGVLLDNQASPLSRIEHPGIELIGLIDPDSSLYGIVEATLRDYEIHAGLIDITDVPGLKTLDVIFMPNRLIHIPRFVRPVLEAVRSGVGLYHEGHCGAYERKDLNDPDLCEYMLAEPPIESYCTGSTNGDLTGHNQPVAGHVVRSHPSLPWLRRGQPVQLNSCCHICRPVHNTTVIATRDQPIRARHSPGLPPCRPPAVIAGQIGRGRALISAIGITQALFGDPSYQAPRFLETLAWLGGPRRVAHA